MNYWVRSHNPARTSSESLFELWTSDGFEWFFVVNIMYPKFAVLAGLMPVTVKFGFLFLVCGLQGYLLSHLSVLAPCFHATETTEAMNNCGVWSLSPSLHCSCRKNLSYAEKQRVWSWSCGLQDLLQMQWLCSHLCYVTAANQWRTVEIELLASMIWKRGCQPSSCRCSQNVTHCRKRFMRHVNWFV